MSRMESLAFALGCLLAVPALGSAQSAWLGSERAPRVAAEFYKGGFDDQDQLKSMSSALFLSGRFRVARDVALIGELPVAFGGLRGDPDASTQVGNPYLGIQLGSLESHAWLELGGRLPVVGSDASSATEVGAYTDIERWSAFWPERATVSGALNVGTREASGIGFRVRAGPELLLPTRSGPDSEVLLYYGAQLSHVRGPLDVSVHAGGAWDATADSGNFGERSLHQAGMAASYDIGGVRPGVTVRLPLDHDMTQVLNYVVGVTLEVPLR